MKLKLALIILLFGLLISCKKEAPLIFSSASFTEESFEICETIGCPEITINYIEAVGDEAVINKVNAQIEKYIIASLNFGEDSIPKAQTIAEAASEFIKIYRLHSADFPDMSAEYFAEINVSELYNSLEIVSLQLRQYLYTGGAHGYGSVAFLNIDPETGIEIPSKALFKDSKEFVTFAEKKFREANDIKAEDPINSTGFWFEDDVFNLPETIGYTQSSLLLVYNQYEIAGYASGPIEIEIAIEEAQPFLTVK